MSALAPLASLLRHYDDLVDYLRRRFGDQHFARDVAQDLCVKLLETPPEEPVREPVAFLRHVSTHLALDRHRSESRHAALLARAGAGVCVAQPPAAPEDAAIAGQTREALLAAVRGLPARCQEVFILHRLYHVPQAEIAERLGISRTMVGRHLSRAAAALQPLLSDPAAPR